MLQLGCLPHGAETRGRDEWELRFGVAGLGLAAREQSGGAGRWGPVLQGRRSTVHAKALRNGF